MFTEKLFKEALSHLVNLPQQKTFLLAVSGGVDSMVLAHLFLQSGCYFEVAHVNYHLRAEDSNQDQELVEAFCVHHNISFHLYDVSESDSPPQNSIENWAREIRYQFFRTLMKNRNLDFTVTAHHLNDQLETFMINLSKASGLQGLSGIPRNSNQIIRPLLDFKKDEIYAFAKAHDIVFREDYTNAENVFLRNRIRNEITPLLLETNSHFLENFNQSIKIIKESKNFIDRQISCIKEGLTLSESNTEVVLDRIKLKDESSFVQFEIFKDYGLESYQEIEKLFLAETGKIFITKSHKIIVDRIGFVIQDKDFVPVNDEMVHLEISIDNNSERIIKVPKKYVAITDIDDFNNWKIDIENLVFPLVLRRPREGDVFFPNAMDGKKKVSKFLKDKKIPIFVKSHVWILADAKDQILGVFPYRQDRRFMNEKADSSIRIIIE